MIHNIKLGLFLAFLPIFTACHTASHVAQQILRRSHEKNFFEPQNSASISPDETSKHTPGFRIFANHFSYFLSYVFTPGYNLSKSTWS